MTIDFYILGECSFFCWTGAVAVPHVGDYVKEDGKHYGDKLKVLNVTWCDQDRVEILTERVKLESY